MSKSKKTEGGSVTVTKGLKLGLPGYSSGTYDVTMSLPLEAGETPAKGMKRVKGEVDKFWKATWSDTFAELHNNVAVEKRG